MRSLIARLLCRHRRTTMKTVITVPFPTRDLGDGVVLRYTSLPSGEYEGTIESATVTCDDCGKDLL